MKTFSKILPSFLLMAISLPVLSSPQDTKTFDQADQLRYLMVGILEASKLEPNIPHYYFNPPLIGLTGKSSISSRQPMVRKSKSHQLTKPVKNSYIVTLKKQSEDEEPLIKKPRKFRLGFAKAKFGKHNPYDEVYPIAEKLHLKGKITAIYKSINAVHINMTEQEAKRLLHNKYVERVTQNMNTISQTTQHNVGTALDTMDETNFLLDSTYHYRYTGAGQTIYILDTGLDLNNPKVRAEFGDRAEIFHDYNPGGNGADCNGHGTSVASAAAGYKYGVAKEANLKIIKVTEGCERSSYTDISIEVFDWLAQNEAPGTIVNWSRTLQNADGSCTPRKNQALEKAIKAAYDAGIIVVIAAGNDGCDVKNFSPTNIPEAFVVASNGAINENGTLIPQVRSFFTRYGENVSGFAPGRAVELMGKDGSSVIENGTSFSAPYAAGVFAVICQVTYGLCQYNTGNAGPIYQALRDVSPTPIMYEMDGTLMTNTPSRFIAQQW